MQLEVVDAYSPDAERIWRELEAQRPDPRGYFLSWGWVENWLACLPPEHAPELAVVVDGATPVAAAYVKRRSIRRHRVLPSRALYLNSVGVARYDALWIEYNGLVGRDLALSPWVTMLRGGWDEIYLPGLRAEAFCGATNMDVAEGRVIIDRRVPSYFVDLEKVRAKDYLSLLTGQTRSQVRRSQREAGELSVEVASTPEQANAFYAEMCALHGELWRAKGKPGAFADPWFDAFHRRLIDGRFAHGEIELVRVRTADGTLGVVYNFVHHGRVLQYQSGLAQYANNHLKPGFIAHTAAIEHAALAGRDVYDFLGGEMRYKKSLSTDCDWLVWARIQRHALRFLVEDRLRDWARARRAASGSAQ